MGARLTTEEFVLKAKNKHGTLFDYSEVEYVNAKTKIVVVCARHGRFEQTPDKHLQSKHGCPECWTSVKPAKMKAAVRPPKPTTTLSEFKSRLPPTTHELDFSGFVGMTKGTVTVWCAEHGEHINRYPKNLLTVVNMCPKCSRKVHPRLKSLEDLISEVRDRYGDKVTVPEQEYVKRKEVVKFNCTKHGEFNRSPTKLLTGQGCSKCTHEEGIREGKFPGGYSEEFFVTHPEKAEAVGYLYYAKIGSVYKIGITGNTVARRLASLRSESKRPTELISVYAGTLGEVFEYEQLILKKFDSERTYRRWSTEVFRGDVLKGKSLLKVIAEEKENMQ